MIREQKNKFWLTLILILSMSFSAVALGVASIFAVKEDDITAHATVGVQAATSSVAKWIDTTGTEKTDLGVISGGSTFKIEKKTTQKDASGKYDVSDVVGTSVDEKTNLTYISNYTITINGTKYSPIPYNGYRITGFDLYDKNGTKFTNVTTGTYTSEQIDPEYTGKITIKAVSVPIDYSVFMYYSNDGIQWQQKEQTFNVATTKSLEGVNVYAGGNVNSFKSWVVKYDAAYKLESGVLKVGNILFTYRGAQPTLETSDNGFKFYRVDKIEKDSYSSVVNNFKEADYTGSAKYASTNPTIRATWSYIYNGLINNTASNSINSSKVGAFSTEDANSNANKATLKIAANQANYGYAFYGNEGKAFTVGSSLATGAPTVNSKTYYVYNYGYEITGWKIYFDLSGNKNATYNGTAWSINNGTGVENTLSTLSSTEMSALADKLDAFFVSGYGNVDINLEPVWRAVSIKILASYKQGTANKTAEIASTTYNANYSISDSSVYAPAGKNIYYYTTTSTKIIAKQHTNGKTIKFNYVEIPQSDFAYASSVYTLNVSPCYVDNIYKVSLIGDATYSSRLYKSLVSGTYTYKLKSLEPLDYSSKNQYQFAKKGTETASLTISTAPGLTKAYSEYSSGSVESYITSCVTPRKTEYENKIKNGTLPVLRKVFTTGNVGTDTLTYTSSSGSETFFIYVANAQDAGYLPIFERNSYDLIAWDNLGTISYITKDYDEDAHKDDFAGRTLKDVKIEKDYLTYFDLSNSGTATDLKLEAHYFRKNYLLDLNTYRDGADEGRYGYIYVEITDIAETDAALNKSGKFIAIHNGIEMQYFKATSNSLNGVSGSALMANPNSLVREAEDGTLCIALYAGCNVTIKASCVDSLKNTSADLNYKEMVGYYLSKVTTTNNCNANQLFAEIAYASINQTNGNVTKTVTDETINGNDSGSTGLNYKTNTKIAIDAYFAPINYKLTIGLKSGTTSTDAVLNPFAGRVDCFNQTTSLDNAFLTITTNVNVENWREEIEYFANAAGYTLQDAAITIVGKDGRHTLLSYNSNQATSETNSQIYSMILDGTWLLNNYYGTTYDARTDCKQTLDVSVNTKLFAFDYYVDIVEDGVVLTSYKNGTAILNGDAENINTASITVTNYKNSLSASKNFDKISRLLIASEFEKINSTEDFYVIKYNGKNYVVLKSFLSQVMDGRNYELDFDFLLNAEDLTETGDTLTQERINSIYGIGNIVAPEDRVLRMQINVSELYTITMKAQAHSNPDPCATVRSTTIQNHRNTYGDLTNSATLVTNGANFNNIQKIYTYKGVENVLTSSYNDKHYSGVVYKLEGSLSNLASNSFVLDRTMVDANNNRTIIITYIPKPITIFDVTYQRNGVEDSSILGTIIEEISKPNSSVEMYFGEGTTYEYKLINPEFVVMVSLNGTSVNANPLLCKVDENVLNASGFFIVVNAIDLPKGVITLKYQLEDISYSCEGDDYGTFEVLIDGMAVPVADAGDGWYSLYVVENKSVEIDISGLNKGYHFVKLGTNKTVNNNKVLLTNRFDLDDDRIYYIVIAKDVVKATLTVDGDYKTQYVMSTANKETTQISSGVTTVDVYVGKTLTFTYVDENREILDYYYYLGTGNAEHKILGDATTQIKLDITSEMLNNLAEKQNNVWALNISAKRTPKYNLTYNIVNADFIENFEINIVEEQAGSPDVVVATYVSETNLITGSIVKFAVTVKDNKTNATGDILEAKYNIVLSGCINSTIGEGETVQKILLDSDKELTITISPKTYNETAYSEFIYNSLQDYKELNPEVQTNEIGGFTISPNLSYGSQAVISLNLKDEEQGELAVVWLSGNDGNTLVVHLNGKQIVSVYDATNNVEYVVSEDDAKHAGATVTVANGLDVLTLNGYNFNFVETGVEKLNITYVVRNEITVRAEYISYKTITPMF